MRPVVLVASLAVLLAISGCEVESKSSKTDPCTVTQNGDGSATIECPDGSTATIAAGKDGDDGLSCHAVEGKDGLKMLECDDGTSVPIVDGEDGKDGAGCTVSDNGDGTHTLACDDGTSITVSDGQDGDDGASCTVADNGDGTSTLSCDDGTSAVVATGASCTVIDNVDGTKTVSCSDGTSTTVSSIVWDPAPGLLPVSGPSSLDRIDMQFFDAQTGYVVWSYDDALYVTTNGGVSWTKKVYANSSPLESRLAGAMHFLSPQEGWVVGALGSQSGDIFHTKDGGDTWTQEFLADGTRPFTRLRDVFAWDSLRAWAVGSTDDRIVATTDGGLSWSVQDVHHGSGLDSVVFASENEGWVAGSGSVPAGILHTVDGGSTWALQYSPGVSKIAILDNGWLVAVGGTPGAHSNIVYSSDMGDNWNYYTTWFDGSDFTPSDFSFIGENMAWAIGVNGVAYRTIDGGTTWRQQHTGTSSDLARVFFVDADHGWILARNGTLLRYKGE